LRVPQDATPYPLVLGLVISRAGSAGREAALLSAAREEIFRWLRPARPRLLEFHVPPSLAAPASANAAGRASAA
jgi:hypothetical protein